MIFSDHEVSSAGAPFEHKVRSMSGPTFEHRNGMEIATFTDASQWEAWLATHGAERREIWMRIARADSGHTTVTADQALDVCLFDTAMPPALSEFGFGQGRVVYDALAQLTAEETGPSRGPRT